MKFILIIDSGVGGLNQVELIKKDFPNANIIYFADNKYCPYGNKSNNFLIKRCLKIIKEIRKKYTISTIIIACNTLSICALNILKKKFKNVFGTLPTFINEKKTILLCTPRTAMELIKKTPNLETKIEPLKDLAYLIETKYPNKIFFDNYVKKQLPILNSYKKIILGCTHYSYIIDSLNSSFKNAKIFDSNFTAYEVYKSKLENNGSGKLIILLSKHTEKTKRKIKIILQNKTILKCQIIDSHIN